MTNELGTTLAELEEQARRKAEALKALSFVCRTIGYLEIVPPYGDCQSRTKEADKAISLCATIRDYIEGKV